MAHDIPTTLVQMAESLDAIAEYTSGVVELAFVGDRILRDAVARRLEIVGEAVARLPEGYLMSHPEVPWRRVKNLRNHLSHKYDDVDWFELFRIVRDDAPILRGALEPLLPPREP